MNGAEISEMNVLCGSAAAWWHDLARVLSALGEAEHHRCHPMFSLRRLARHFVRHRAAPTLLEAGITAVSPGVSSRLLGLLSNMQLKPTPGRSGGAARLGPAAGAA